MVQQLNVAAGAHTLPGVAMAETTANSTWDSEVPSGSYTALSTQPSMDTISGSIPSAAMSVADDSSNTLTVIPVTPGMNLLKQATLTAAEHHQQLLQQTAASINSRRRLFFSQLSADCTEDHIRAVFGQYGVVEQVQMYSDASSTPNSGCGYVTMASQEQAASALAALQQNHSLPPPLSCLAVSWALAVEQQQQQQQQAWGSQQSSLVANAGRTVFFAKVPPSAVSSEVEQLFAAFGKLSEVNLFRAWAGAKHSKGCGLITYVDRQAAGNAIAQLHGKYVFPGSDCPMVVEWMDLKKQRPIAPPPATEKPPLGCSCDAYKLLLGNVPISMSEEELVLLLGQFGRVVQISLAAEATGVTSSGHVWYATKMGADALSSRAKTEPIWLRDERTQQELALSVRKARRPGGSSSTSSSLTMNVACAVRPGPGGGCSSTTFSSSSNSSLLPAVHMAGAPAADVSGQLLQFQAAGGLSGLGSDIIQLLPMQQLGDNSGPLVPVLPGMAAGVAGLPAAGGAVLPGLPTAVLRTSDNTGGYMAVDMCEAMLDLYDTSGMGLPMPVHLQPAMAAQMANKISLHGALQQQQQQQRLVYSNQVNVLSGAGLASSCGTVCMSSPANLALVNKHEGSFSMAARSGVSPTAGLAMSARTSSLPQQAQQMMAPLQLPGHHHQQQQQPQQQLVAGNVMWHGGQQQVMLLPQSSGMVQAAGPLPTVNMLANGQQPQQQAGAVAAMGRSSSIQSNASSGGGLNSSIAVPINPAEVQSVAEKLGFFAHHSGAQVTITSLPDAGLAVLLSGRAEQVAMAQSLLGAARNQQ